MEDRNSLQQTSLSSLDAALTRVNAADSPAGSFGASQNNRRRSLIRPLTGDSFDVPKLLFLSILRPTYRTIAILGTKRSLEPIGHCGLRIRTRKVPSCKDLLFDDLLFEDQLNRGRHASPHCRSPQAGTPTPLLLGCGACIAPGFGSRQDFGANAAGKPRRLAA